MGVACTSSLVAIFALSTMKGFKRLNLSKLLDNYRLEDTTLYVTLEPCPMCAMAMVHARVSRVVFGAWDVKAGGAGSIVNIFTLPGLNHRVDVFGGVLMDECAEKLTKFFRQRRSQPPGD